MKLQVGQNAHEDGMEVSHNQWLLGDWDSLAKLDAETLENHPRRARLALYAAAGHAQTGQIERAKEFLALAKAWGCSKKLISRALISGVYNTLGRAAIASGQEARALSHFEQAIFIAYQSSTTPLLVQARMDVQLAQLAQVSTAVAAISPNIAGNGTHQIALHLASLARSCIASEDLHASAQQTIEQNNLTDSDLFDFLIALSDQIAQAGDKMTALHYLQQARTSLRKPTRAATTAIVKRLVALGQAAAAEAIITQAALDGTGILPLNDKERAAIQKASQEIHEAIGKKNAHGHDLLLSAFAAYLPTFPKHETSRKPILIEIGTTREEVPGQGSTRKLAQYCLKSGIDFITVDMDPHNSQRARQLFAEIGASGFQAVAMKGEDYLREYSGSFDFVFLDAYDFDHGMHSELRQSRYERFLGSRIDEIECHKMHLDCAQSVLLKLSPSGLVCVDDTWLEDGKWTAKGTLAMPFLLANGFELVEARNRAALLRRKNGKAEEQSA